MQLFNQLKTYFAIPTPHKKSSQLALKGGSSFDVIIDDILEDSSRDFEVLYEEEISEL